MKFKVGDFVECVMNDNGSSEYVGKQGKITIVYSRDKYCYAVDFCCAHFSERELELVKTKDFYKVGQKFTTNWGSNRFDGSVLEIVEVRQNEGYPYRVKVVEVTSASCSMEKVGSVHSWRDDGNGDMNIINKFKNNNKNMASKVGIMMKKLLDKDTQVLVKAGFINGDLDITSEGEKALYALIFQDKKAELVVLANEKLAEEKEEKGC